MELIPLIAITLLLVGAVIWMVRDLHRISKLPHYPMGKYTESPNRVRLSR